LLVCLLPLTGCTGLFFYPSHQEVQTPERLGLVYENISLQTVDGVRLHAWYLPAQGTAQGTILHLHGNAENISTFIASVWWLPARPASAHSRDSRAAARCSRAPDVGGLHRDAEAALGWLVNRGGVNRDRLILLGQSLGGSVALYTAAHAARRDYIRAVVTEGAFSGYRRIAREKMALLWLTRYLRWPLAWLFNDDYSAEEAMPRIGRTPVLLIHGADDEVIPPSHAQRLYEAAAGPRDLWLIPGGRHADNLTKPDVRERLIRYLDALPAAAAAGRQEEKE
jgi:uncharacterized protein